MKLSLTNQKLIISYKPALSNASILHLPLFQKALVESTRAFKVFFTILRQNDKVSALLIRENTLEITINALLWYQKIVVGRERSVSEYGPQ